MAHVIIAVLDSDKKVIGYKLDCFWSLGDKERAKVHDIDSEELPSHLLGTLKGTITNPDTMFKETISKRREVLLVNRAKYLAINCLKEGNDDLTILYEFSLQTGESQKILPCSAFHSNPHSS